MPASQSLGLYARASLDLSANFDESTLRRHAELLAKLTDSDLVLIYESPLKGGTPELLAQWGLPSEAVKDFQTLGSEKSTGAGGLRALADDATPLRYHPLTRDLLNLGIKAYWAYPLWSDGVLRGQIFFGSRSWDHFHEDTLSVFAATTIQIAHALEKRRICAEVESTDPSWSDDGGATAAGKRRQFIAVLAHELRNPVAPIRSGLDLLSTGLLDDEGRQTTVDMMQRQLAHLVRLVDDLLDTARLDTGRLQVKRQPVRLKDVVRSAIEGIRPALESKAQALKLDDDAAEVVVDVDPVRLSQAFVNILSANVKHTPEGGVIAVSVVATGKELSIIFEDQGDGVSAAEINNVFQLFPITAEQKSEDGLGIGLALVKGLVELNEGRIEMQNREAENGSMYTVTLPRANVELESMETLPAGDDPPTWPSHRVLVVDDNRDAADTLGLLFELDGHTVRIAHDGPTAVVEAKEFQPEVILMDIGLPGFNGNEATQRIRQQASAVRPFIIALTGWGAEADLEATREAGCDMHLVKPISHEDLRKTILQRVSERK